MANKTVLMMQFNDAKTGELITGHLSFEQWDMLSIAMENSIAQHYKKHGYPKRDV